MAGQDINNLLEQWCKWLLPRTGTNDPANDFDGDVHDEANKTNNPWFIAGTWNVTTPQIREIHPPAGMGLFVVAASSHATPDELPAGQTGTEPNLKAHAETIDGTWLHAGLFKGGETGPLTPEPLKPAKTGMFEVKIPASSRYATLTGVHGDKVKMAVMGRVCIYTPPAGRSRLVIGSMAPQRPDVGRRGEAQYNVQVEYMIETT